MRQFSRLLIVPLLLASACAAPEYQDVDAPSGFSPLVPREGIEEYQIIWGRSWKPTIYVQITARTGGADGGRSAVVRIGEAEYVAPKFRSYQLTANEWRKIEVEIEALGFWTREFACAEESYRSRTLIVYTSEGCVRIVMTDGARLSMAGSKESRARGLNVVCPDLEECPPFDTVVRSIFDAVGRPFD